MLSHKERVINLSKKSKDEKKPSRKAVNKLSELARRWRRFGTAITIPQTPMFWAAIREIPRTATKGRSRIPTTFEKKLANRIYIWYYNTVRIFV